MTWKQIGLTLGALAILMLLYVNYAHAATVCNVFNGCTGKGTFTSSQLIYGNGTSPFSSVATTTLAGTGPVSVSNSPVVIGGSGAVISCATATGSVDGCLSHTDWTTFNGKGSGSVTSVATNNGITGGTITTTGTIGLATINAGVLGAVTNGAVPTSQATSTLYGTGTGGQILTWNNGVPQWVATTTFSAPLVFSAGNVTITNASAGVTGALTGTDWTTFNNKLSAAITTLGPTGQGQTGATQTLATSTGSFNGLTLGLTIVGATNSQTFTPSITGTLNNAGLANSTISGIALGSTLAALSATDSTLTFSGSYTGATARTIGLNLGNANTFTALQQFNGSASSTNFSANYAQIGATATTTLGSDGKIVANDVANSWTGRLNPTRSFALQTGTTTTWTASTTGTAYSPYITMPFAGTLKQVRCATDASFLGVNVQVNGSNATPSYFVASTTVGKETFTSGNTFTAGQKILMNVGTTTTASSLSLSCTFDSTETP